MAFDEYKKDPSFRPYDLQMKALTDLARQQEQLEDERVRQSEDAQRMATIGQFAGVASKPVITAAEIMAKQKPVDQSGDIERLYSQSGQLGLQGVESRQKALLDKYKMQKGQSDIMQNYLKKKEFDKDKEFDKWYKMKMVEGKQQEYSGKQQERKLQRAEKTYKNIEKETGNLTQVENQISRVDNTIKSLLDFESSSIAGTGPIAEWGFSNPLFNADAENLDRQFKQLQLAEMKKQFAGMAKAIDSDAERKFFSQSQANIGNRPETNVQILLGMKSVAMKERAEAVAKKNYLESSPDGTLMGYESPVMNKVTTMVKPDGEMQLVFKDKLKDARKMGLMTVDEYSKQIFGPTERAMEPSEDEFKNISDAELDQRIAEEEKKQLYKGLVNRGK